MGPGHNAHGPNENLHLDFAKKGTACLTHFVADLYGRLKKWEFEN